MHHADVRPTLEEFRDQAGRFIAEALDADALCPAFGAIMPPRLHERARAWQRRVHAAGFAGIHWPTEFGGRGLGREYTAAWSEACARAGVQPYLNLQGLILAGEAILREGTAEQRAALLPPTLSGEILWCQLFSEPGAGSDLGSLTTSALRDGDHYVLNGQKVWCSNGQFAEYGIALVRTDRDRRDHRGLSFFLLDMRSPGIDVRPLRQMTGDQEFCEVFLDDVVTPVASRLGPEHEGWTVAMEVLQDERGSSGATGLIGLEQRLARLAAGKTGDVVMGDRLMHLLARGHALRSMLLGPGGVGASSATKLLRTELEFEAELLEAELRGAEAMLVDQHTSGFLYAPGMKIAGGTSEIQRNIIGERVLGLPREPRPAWTSET